MRTRLPPFSTTIACCSASGLLSVGEDAAASSGLAGSEAGVAVAVADAVAGFAAVEDFVVASAAWASPEAPCHAPDTIKAKAKALASTRRRSGAGDEMGILMILVAVKRMVRKSGFRLWMRQGGDPDSFLCARQAFE